MGAYPAPVTITGRPRRVCVALELLESRVDVAVRGRGAAHLAASLETAWDRCLAGGPASPASTRLEAFLDEDQSAVHRARSRGALAASDESEIMHGLASSLTIAAISARLGELWMLHACAVADPATGATVVLVAPSGGGKTTAAAALGRHFGYVTDETAAIRADGAVVPFPKPLSVVSDGRTTKHQASPTQLGLLQPPAEPWLAAIALLDRTGTGAPTVEPVRTVEALPALAGQTSALHLLDRPLHLVADHLHRTGGLRRITYREAEHLVPVISDLVGVSVGSGAAPAKARR